MQNWKLSDFIWIILYSAVLMVTADFIIELPLIDFLLNSLPYESIKLLIKFLIQSFCFFIPLYFYTFRKYGNRWSDFGFQKISPYKVIIAVISAYFFYLGLTIFITELMFSFGLDSMPGFQKQEPFLPLLGKDLISIPIAILMVSIIAPLIEELFFRGFCLQLFINKTSPVLGNILCAALFATIHFEFQSIIPLFLLGLILNWLFIKFKSIWPGLIFHSFNNTIALIIEYYLLSHPELLG